MNSTFHYASGKITAFSGKEVSTGVEEATTFYPAEEGHQKYLEKQPGGYCNHRRRFRWSDIVQ
jgi:peptide-methionine (S)-S-oxide reductase